MTKKLTIIQQKITLKNLCVTFLDISWMLSAVFSSMYVIQIHPLTSALNKDYKIMLSMVAIFVILCIKCIFMIALPSKKNRVQVLLDSLSDTDAQPVRQKVDAYFKSLGHTDSGYRSPYLQIKNNTLEIRYAQESFDKCHIIPLQKIVKDELCLLFQKRKLKTLLTFGINIPLFTTHPTSHQVFSMAALQHTQNNHTSFSLLN
jgi:hypothetical protein